MRRTITAFASLALVAAAGQGQALAQDAEYSAPEMAGPQYREITQFEVSPGDAAAFEMAIEKIVTAAEQAGLSADFGWLFYRDGSDFTLVYPIESMAYFDDEQQWMRQFQGTPGEALLMEAFGEFTGLHYSSSSHVIKVNPEHTYRPATPIENPNYVQVIRNWVAPGQQEAHAENTVKLLALIEEVGWPYEVYAFETVIGDGGLRVYVIPYDDKALYYGDNSLSAYLAQNEKAEAWEALVVERRKLLRDSDDLEMELVPAMTYMPAAEAEPEAGDSN
jgi:hypothetical protein